jgi:hypothetical protein
MTAAPDDTLTVNWSPNLGDAYASLRLGFWGTPGRVVRSLFLLFVLPALLFGWILSVSMGRRFSTAQLVTIASLSALAWGALFALAFGAWLARFVVKNQRARGDPQRIVIGPQTIERNLKDSKVTHPWTAISSVEETGPAFILLGAAGPLTSIEKSGIPSAAELHAVRAYLRAKRPGKYFPDEST